jgi:hypothetical protein
MKHKSKILLVVESLPRASDGSLRPVVTAIRPAPWWIRLWDAWRRRKEQTIPVNTDIETLEELTAIYALDTDPYVLHLLMRPHRIGQGCTVSTDDSRLRMTVTPTEETIMCMFNAMSNGKPKPV